ncbi:MAG: 16S rRNA (cytidine(1402)-2'-O)-methyltransferase [Oscillospiraceae bacterium]|nr:16S rRNA (cytidine(1402)-2'-O)-methyltransferase [Oscillospiraceae bacterium]
MFGKLYVIGTPIGNLGDISRRGIETLELVDFIAAEDTRVSIKLLNHLNIKKKMMSYFKYNIKDRGEVIIDRIKNGENCGIITDAGMPCISDPGADLVRQCLDEDIDVRVIPGPVALISALAISGMNTTKFYFEGFLNTQLKNRIERLEKIKYIDTTLIFYASPHKIIGDLNSMYKIFGDRSISVVKEITKINESVMRFSLLDSIEYYTNNKPKGEYVVLVEGYVEPSNQDFVSIDDAIDMVSKFVKDGEKPIEAIKFVSIQTGISKRELYKVYVDN